MYFGQYIQAIFVGGACQFVHLPVFKTGHDQEYAVGAERTRFDNLIRVDHKVLADDRQAASGARGLQMCIAALKKTLVGQYR